MHNIYIHPRAAELIQALADCAYPHEPDQRERLCVAVDALLAAMPDPRRKPGATTV